MDPRIKKLAKILTEHSLKIKRGSLITVNAGIEAKELVLELSKLILKKEAFPKINLELAGFAYIYFKTAKDWQLKRFTKTAMYEAKQENGRISIGSEYNTKELTNINPKKIFARQKTTKPIHDLVIKKDNWIIVEFPTNALAQDAEMSLEEFENFVFNATNIDWKKTTKKLEKIKKIIDKGKTIRIIGKNTDLSFSIKGRKAIVCNGKRNMPDGEVFVSPVENSASGHIEYSFPTIYSNREISGIKLDFKKGKVIKASA